MYGVVLGAGAGFGAAALAFATGFFFATIGFFAAFLGAAFFFAGRFMSRNLQYASSASQSASRDGRPRAAASFNGYGRALGRIRPSTTGAMVPWRVTASSTTVARSGPLSAPTTTRPRANAVFPSPPRSM